MVILCFGFKIILVSFGVIYLKIFKEFGIDVFVVVVGIYFDVIFVKCDSSFMCVFYILFVL